MKKTIFFDRDGTLIIDKVYLNDPEQIEYLPGVFPCLQKLRDAGYQFVIVTNQSGVPRGLVTIANLDEIHRRIVNAFKEHGVEFVGIYYAPYSVESNHEMRKPNPGMLHAGAKDHAVDLKNSWMIGDRITDVQAGQRAGCRTILLTGVETDEAISASHPDFVATGIPEMTEFILNAEASRPLSH